MAVIHHATRRVEFSDTDMAGIVHFARFFCFMEAAEHELLRSIGLSVIIEQEDGRISFPRVGARCDYRKPARFEDELTIEARVVKLGTKSVTYGFNVFRGEEVIALGEITTVCCQINAEHGMAPIDIPDWIRAKLSAK